MPHALRDIESLEFLTKPLHVVDEPGMDTMDADFREICDLAHTEDYQAAATLIEPLLADEVYDLRLVTIYFLARFVRVGLSALSGILRGAQALIGINLEAFGPRERRQKHVDKRLAWTFTTVVEQGRYHHSKVSETWERWTRDVPASEIHGCLELARSLAPSLDQPHSREAAQALAALIAWLEDLGAAWAQPQEQAPHPSETPVPVELVPAASKSRFSGTAATVPIAVSHEFVALTQKLGAFEQLISHNRFERAALVANDITRELESFDPRRYFPEFFATYGRLMQRHIDRLAPYGDGQDTPAYRALEQLYRVDLSGFVGGDSE